MKKLSIIGLATGTALLCALPVSLQLSQNSLSISVDKAGAVVGRPLTPGSVAGVHRRHHRRAARRGYYDVAADTATPQNWGYGNGTWPGYGVTVVGVAAGAVAAPTPYNGNWSAWNGAGPGYGVAAPVLPARAVARSAAYYGATEYGGTGAYVGAVYPTRAIYAAGYVPPSYYGPVCNPRVDNLCQ